MANNIVLVPDSAKVIKASQIARKLRKKNVKQVAEELGIEHTRLWRFMRKQGYSRQESWQK